MAYTHTHSLIPRPSVYFINILTSKRLKLVVCTGIAYLFNYRSYIVVAVLYLFSVETIVVRLDMTPPPPMLVFYFYLIINCPSIAVLAIIIRK